jgi:hypothetical protein
VAKKLALLAGAYYSVLIVCILCITIVSSATLCHAHVRCSSSHMVPQKYTTLELCSGCAVHAKTTDACCLHWFAQQLHYALITFLFKTVATHLIQDW